MKKNKPDIEIEAAKVVLGISAAEQLPSIAGEFLLEGLDSPALRLLAGLNKSEMGEAISLFKQAFVEMGLPLPETREAVLQLSREIAEKILCGEVKPYEGSKQIWEISLKIEHALPIIHPFVYAASEWEDRPEDRSLFENSIIEAANAIIEDNQGING